LDLTQLVADSMRLMVKTPVFDLSALKLFRKLAQIRMTQILNVVV